MTAFIFVPGLGLSVILGRLIYYNFYISSLFRKLFIFFLQKTQQKQKYKFRAIFDLDCNPQPIKDMKTYTYRNVYF